MNINKLIKQAQEVQTRITEMQSKIGDMEIEGQSGAGMVKIIITGKGEMKKIAIDPKMITPDEKEILEDLIVAAFNDAKRKADTETENRMNEVTGGLQLPPGMKFPI